MIWNFSQCKPPGSSFSRSKIAGTWQLRVRDLRRATEVEIRADARSLRVSKAKHQGVDRSDSFALGVQGLELSGV
jgi:hypothetical protein